MRDRSADLLTGRESEVLAAMASGRTNAAIAASLYISRKSVEKHVNSIFSKLALGARDEVHPRVRAVLIYLESLGQDATAPASPLPQGLPPRSGPTRPAAGHGHPRRTGQPAASRPWAIRRP